MSSSGHARDPATGPGHGRDISVAEAEARYHRERLALYKARVLSGKPTSPGRLRELERSSAHADAWARQVRGSAPAERAV